MIIFIPSSGTFTLRLNSRFQSTQYFVNCWKWSRSGFPDCLGVLGGLPYYCLINCVVLSLSFCMHASINRTLLFIPLTSPFLYPSNEIPKQNIVCMCQRKCQRDVCIHVHMYILSLYLLSLLYLLSSYRSLFYFLIPPKRKSQPIKYMCVTPSPASFPFLTWMICMIVMYSCVQDARIHIQVWRRAFYAQVCVLSCYSSAHNTATTP